MLPLAVSGDLLLRPHFVLPEVQMQRGCGTLLYGRTRWRNVSNWLQILLDGPPTEHMFITSYISLESGRSPPTPHFLLFLPVHFFHPR